MLTAIIIDDESSSRNALKQKLIHHCKEVQIISECENGEEGIKSIEENKPDIVFLDVEMPRINGFTMLQQITNRDFEVIFTTAYDHYAIKAIRISAIDYLVKPIEVEELKTAVELAKQKRLQQNPNKRIDNLLNNISEEKEMLTRIAISSMEGLLFVNIGDIIYLEAESNYTLLYLTGSKKITVSKTLKEFEELLPPLIFIRIHHSYIINKKFIQRYIKGEGGQVVMSNNKMLDVSRRKKEEFMKSISN